MRLLALLLLTLTAAACGRPGSEPDGAAASSADAGMADSGPVKVVVTLPPLAWPAEFVLGGRAEITVLLPAGASPHHWEPTPSDALAVAEADYVLAAGPEDRARVEPLIKDAELLVMSGDDHHAWLDLWAMLRFTFRVAESVGVRLPPDSPDPRAWPHLQTLNNLLIITGHDAWSEFFRPTTSPVMAMRASHHGEPGAARLAEIRQRAENTEYVLVVFEPGEDEPWLRALAEEVGAASVTLDPIGTRDWLGDMEKRHEAVRAALESLE